ncbi:MAG: T9SS type A sorting domain-containing protein, partial [Ignavibacteria bacterium]|nr:T9SS type A sorting domain-containing protein [Ignavibacteria bacterium]
ESGTKDEREVQLGKTLRKEQLAESNTEWEQVGAQFEIISTVELKKALTLKLSYTEEELNAVRVRYPEFDERKVGVYREEDGNWVYEGGEGRERGVTAKIEKTGSLALFYNPTHEFLPKSIELSQNYPNPFNPSTTIKFGLPDEGRVKLVIYNILGQKVKELINETRGAGYHTAIWNGKNETGTQVSSGLYIYRLEMGKGVQSKKMLLIK